MKIEEIELSSLTPYENNPRNNTEAIDKVAESIKQFGFKVPIIIDKNKIIVAGHTRYLAAQKLGIKKVPCIIASDLSPRQINAFRLADNKVAEFSTWDMPKLQKELVFLGDSFKMDDFGFNFDIPEIDTEGFFEPVSPTVVTASQSTQQPGTSDDEFSDEDKLPEELQGVQMQPDELTKISGTDSVARERLIIVYKKEDETKVAALLGLKTIDKVIYPFEEFEKNE